MSIGFDTWTKTKLAIHSLWAGRPGFDFRQGKERFPSKLREAERFWVLLSSKEHMELYHNSDTRIQSVLRLYNGCRGPKLTWGDVMYLFCSTVPVPTYTLNTYFHTKLTDLPHFVYLGPRPRSK